MYQPRRASRAIAVERSGAEAFEVGPRRATRRPAGALLSRVAPAIVSLTVLAGGGGIALTANADQAATAVPAPVRDADRTSRSDTRTDVESSASASTEADTAEGSTDSADPTEASALVGTEAPVATPEPVANDAFVGAAWADAFGAPSGTRYAQEALQVRSQADGDAPALGKLTEAEKVSVTDKVVDGWTQVVYGEKAGYVRTDQLGTEPPAKPEAKPSAGSASGEKQAAKTGGKLQWPTAGSISSPWGMRKHPILGYTRLHGGADIGGKTGQPIYAAEDGVVTKAATGYNSGSGNNVRIDHGTLSGKAAETSYLHMSTIKVKVGQLVSRGQVIGTVGSTGLSTAPHLHFSLYLNGTNSNPAPWLG